MKKIIIVGGGTAGWMAANILAYSFKKSNIEICLIESPEISTVGVGEGSTPALRNFFDLLNIKESDWMPACNATFKTGIRFNDWSTVKDYESYFHSFPSELDFHTQNSFFYNARLRASGINVNANPSDFYLSSSISQLRKHPIPKENFPFEIDYAYHFDSSLLGKYLQKVAKDLGVKHVVAHVENIKITREDRVSSVELKNGEVVKGDFFIDCTGFKGVIINQFPDTEFVSYGSQLLNDSAVTISTPLTNRKISAATESTALDCGWTWKIPLTNRYGNGYVYSSKHISKEDAEKELKTHLNILDDNIAVRHLSFKLGRNNKHWNRNCLAVGLSQGFIEPLEATALLLIQQTVGKFVDYFEKGKFTNKYQTDFNNSVNSDFDGIKEYVLLHYTLNTRRDTPYWIENSKNFSNMDARILKLLHGWRNGADISQLIVKLGLSEYYPIPSWYAILSGNGYFPQDLNLPNRNHTNDNFKDAKLFIQRCTMNYIDYEVK
ncbi:tryptophan halogenase family protein [Paraglaciecola arctica]|uniref:tryptophan halogenase family protein n=1 Tax=Paraglaciecola arctica TaxID=1128911 RepID=UPI001C06E17F|nr:tryptophan halogenase family protein [Paraglaciecola arctica]MBU3005550.1 tryptophan 7-halogenase [Paraglaciecola arctica]